MFSNSMRKYFKVFIFTFVLFTFTYFNVYNSINASTIAEENVEVDEESKTSVEQNEYYGYGCYNCTDLIEIECNLSYSYSKKNGTYQLALNSTNCPYPMIQYYTWEVTDSGDETVTIGNWGHVTSTGITEAIIVGTYELNHRVRLYINLNITE